MKKYLVITVRVQEHTLITKTTLESFADEQTAREYHAEQSVNDDTLSCGLYILTEQKEDRLGRRSSLIMQMTVAEALREINKANSRLFRLSKGQFEGQTPASKVLQNNIKKLGLEMTQK